MDPPFWIDIDIEPADTLVRITARGSRGEITSPRLIPITLERLETFARKVGHAMKRRQPVDESTLAEAHALYAALFDGEFRDLAVRYNEAAKGTRVLHRLLLRSRGLQAVPWEALCQPASSEGFWSTSPTIHLARGVPSPDPWKPCEMQGAPRLLVIAPGVFEDATVRNLHKALAGSIAAGEIEWLEPIVGPKASRDSLFDSLDRSKRPHILHYIGHGDVDTSGHPTLRLTDTEDGDEDWIKVESLAGKLAAKFSNELRLVVLEACDGAKPGHFGSAAELLNRAGIAAVLAHLWPVQADAARTCSRALYRSLTATGIAEGNVASSVADVRQLLLLDGAVAFSPVLYLRGRASTLFHFKKTTTPSPTIPPDTTPTPFGTLTIGTVGTQWLTGPLMPIWSGGQATASKLRFELQDTKGNPIELVLAESRVYRLGREPLRADGKTPNDCILPSQRVSQDAATLENVEGRWSIRNTSGKRRVRVNLATVEPGEMCPLVHGNTVVVGDASAVFRDSRFHGIAPPSAVDARTGLLSREGLTCEVGLALATPRKARVLLVVFFGAEDAQSACVAARLLHEADPAAPIGRIETSVGMLVEDKSTLAKRFELVRRAGISPLAAGFLELTGPSTEAGARVEAALGALVRIAMARDTDGLVDLAKYALQGGTLEELAHFAREARSTGGGLGLLLLDELDRYGALGEASRAAIELELREQLGALLQPSDRITSAGPGAVAVATKQSVDRLLRAIATGWRARGPIAVGKLELERSLRVFVLDEATTAQLVAQPAAFLREMGTGTNAQGLPTPIAYWLDAAQGAATTLERATALVRTVEATWRLLGCILVTAFWATRKGKALPAAGAATTWPAWSGVAIAVAETLHAEESRVGELAKAVWQAWQTGTGALRRAAEQASSLSSLVASGSDPRALARATTSLELTLHEVFGSLRALRGWSLVAVRGTTPADLAGEILRVDAVDFTGPHSAGVQRRHTVTGIRVLPFVYLMRWAEGVAIPLEPLIRYVRVPGANIDGLVFMDGIPSGPGFYAYTPVNQEGRIELEVTERQLAR